MIGFGPLVAAVGERSLRTLADAFYGGFYWTEDLEDSGDAGAMLRYLVFALT